MCPSLALKTPFRAPRGGCLSHCAVRCCQKHWDIFRPESEHATSRQTALRKASFQLWNFGRICHLLNRKTAETVVHAYVTSCLNCEMPCSMGFQRRYWGSSRVCRTQRPALSPERTSRHLQQRPANAAALAACQFSGGLQNPPPDLPFLAWSGPSVPLLAADCLQIPTRTLRSRSQLLLC